MHNPKTVHPFLLRFIILIYLFFFIAAIGASGYLLLQVAHAKPILLIELLKYTLLLFLFLTLLVIDIKAINLRPSSLQHFANSTKNFKWLFVIVIAILILVRLGIIKTEDQKYIEIGALQIALFTAAAIFCTWSDRVMTKYNEAEAEASE